MPGHNGKTNFFGAALNSSYQPVYLRRGDRQWRLQNIFFALTIFLKRIKAFRILSDTLIYPIRLFFLEVFIFLLLADKRKILNWPEIQLSNV
jgi:hypothetical protein